VKDKEGGQRGGQRGVGRGEAEGVWRVSDKGGR